MTQSKFLVTGDQLVGRGLTFDISVLAAPKDRDARLVEIGEAIYLQGRESVQLSYDARFDLVSAAETLRALAVVLGPGYKSEQCCRAAALISQLLQEQEKAP